MTNPNSILQSHKLRITDCRLEIIQEFLNKNIALSHADLEETLNNQFDLVTIYRTLKTFLDKDLIHKVLDDSGATKYALCAHGETEHSHNHEHVHFKCEKCPLRCPLGHARLGEGLPRVLDGHRVSRSAHPP